MDGQIDISLPIEEIAKRKIEFHLSQIDIHTRAISDLRTKFRLSSDDIAIEDKTQSNNEEDDWDPDKTILIPAHRSMKPFILKILGEEKNKKFTTNDIYNLVLQKNGGNSGHERSVWIAIISQSFNALCTSGKVIKKPIDGEKGNYYIYNNEYKKSSEIDDFL